VVTCFFGTQCIYIFLLLLTKFVLYIIALKRLRYLFFVKKHLLASFIGDGDGDAFVGCLSIVFA